MVIRLLIGSMRASLRAAVVLSIAASLLFLVLLQLFENPQ